jgi:hypothetical protein
MSIHERIPGSFPAGSRPLDPVQLPPEGFERTGMAPGAAVLHSLALQAFRQGCGLGWRFMEAAEANGVQRPPVLKADSRGGLQRWEVGPW